ncbi:MAG: hypothetical protein AAGG72_07820 [Pseudomonadota bacterium]
MLVCYARMIKLLIVFTGCFALMGLPGWVTPAFARSDAQAFAATLKTKDRQAFEAYYQAQVFYQADVDAYWGQVAAKRKKRRAKIRRKQTISTADYVTNFPPKYDGPKLSKRLARKWKRFKTKPRVSQSKKKPSAIDSLADFLRAAKRHYDFTPERISEREFKRRYAREALRLGLSGEQVVRVYALETGGNGTADMQAGIHPISKKGRPISTALGYAQLLAANSTSELAKHGDGFVRRLRRLAATTNNAQRRRRLATKIESLRKMVRKAKSIPYSWARHRRFARTGPGMGLHALNLDGDVGPWLQVIKLRGIKDLAIKNGRRQLSSEQLELMNLAGPGTGLEMMRRTGLGMPTANFFARRGYERNSVVRGRTSRQLLSELGRRMDVNARNKGAREFKAIFKALEQVAPPAGAAAGRLEPTTYPSPAAANGPTSGDNQWADEAVIRAPVPRPAQRPARQQADPLAQRLEFGSRASY